MRVERVEQAHQLTEGQLILDNNQNLWKVHKFLHKAGPYKGREDTWLVDFAGDEYPFIVDPSNETYAHGEDAPLPWLTVKVVPDDGLPRPVLPPCPVCGKADWPEGGMHAARDIHLRAHERSNSSTMCVCGDMATVLMPGAGNVFAPHVDRKTGEPCPGIPTPKVGPEPPVPAESLDWITRRPL